MIIRAAWVLPITAPPIRDGFVEFDGATIRRVGAWFDLVSREPTNCADFHFQTGVLLPGFVNPHAHLELTGYAGMVPRSTFWPWIGQLARLRRELDTPTRIEEAVVSGARECLRNGITCVGDISRRNQAWRTLKLLPIRKVCFAELLTIADYPARTLAELRAEVESIEEDELLTAGISPHAPYTVPMEDVRSAIEFAARIDRPWTLHLAETREELEYLGGNENALPEPLGRFARDRGMRSPQMSLSEYMRRVISAPAKGSLAHMNYAEPEVYDLLASSGVSVLYCPGAHQFFNHTNHPFRAMTARGVQVAFGTDSAASNTGLSMISELRVARDAEPSIRATELLGIATLQGARALGLDGKIGSLESGKQADLAVFEIGTVAPDPAAALLEVQTGATAVWVAGRLDFVRKSS